MRIILEDNDKLMTFILDETIENSWITDSKRNNLVNVIKKDNKWFLKSNIEIKILKDINSKENEVLTNINQIDEIELTNFLSFYIYELETKKIRKIHCLPVYDNTMIQLIIDFTKVNEIVIGNSKNCTIKCSNNNFIEKQITIKFENNTYKVFNNNIKIPMYINNILETEYNLSNGDMIFIDSLMFSIVGNILLINNPNNTIFYDSLKLAKRLLPNNEAKDYSTTQENFIEVYNKNEYFQRPPRFKRSIEEKEYIIDPPTPSQKREEMPLIYTLGPMMLMGVTSLMSGITAIMNVIEGKSTFKENATSIITTISMMASMILFPLLQKIWNKNNILKQERKRKRKYKKYINTKKEQILQEIEIQRQILIENNLDLSSVANVVLNKQRTLWDRKLEHNDFLDIRIGVGTVKPKIKIEVPEEHFTMEEDNLKEMYIELFDTIKDMDNVPVTNNFIENRITGIVGKYNYVKTILDGLMLNLMTFHSYDMLKIIILTSEEKKNTWEKYRNIPHFWNNDKTFRFIGINSDGVNKVSNTLIQIYNERINSLDNEETIKNTEIYKKFKEYYLIITDEVEYLKNSSIFNEIKKDERNLGFSFVIITDKIDNLPNECVKFINLEPNNCAIFETELISTKQKNFIPDIPNFNMSQCYLSLCNIPIDIAQGKYILPKVYSFLEMYNVGSVKQLNILNRWKNNNIITSLAAPVGINEQGDLFKIDLHEKAHGPHGLVAGMTGSGKSEWIISYILSMCINYHPDEVQFVLIDYKGGGLAGTFENKETGIKIPHLVGTITNLDISEINRSLASINSELKRRQTLFNQARDKLGESSVDIYKYQKWYRDGKIDEPISHLFIISDEFAELKKEQPEFMTELISTARIGRSLGVHLILATQKPSGVVDDQIWSNSKFRVCLKVQDKSDSNDMIRMPDAAYLKETGRFYFQVGYNEFFAKGQSAYAGLPYYESDRHKKTIDTDIVFLDNNGDIFKEVNSDKKVVDAIYKGEELSNILKEIIETSKTVDTHIKKLWLDTIPENIYIDELLQKYKYEKENFVLNPVIGEYDAPQYQKQGLLTLPLSENGNTIIWGNSGSGKEKLLTTMLYSLMTTHYSQEVNVYVLDFGAEILNCFKKSAIIGDIISSTEEDKIKNYFKFIYQEFEERKKLFQEYNGDYYTYIKTSGNIKPIILNIINNFENFNEIFGDTYLEVLTKIIREAEKYGIIFIITANSSNSISYRLSQYFKQNVCLQLKDIYDYRSLLGNNIKFIPSNIKGRGIINVDGEAFEFQTANPKNINDLNNYISQVSIKISTNQNFAKSIKSLPDIVDYNFIKEEYNDLYDLPIGVETDNLNIYKYNFLNNYFNIITSNDTDNLNLFTKSLIELISIKKSTLKVVVFDGEKTFDKVKENVTYIKDNYLESFKSFNVFLDKISEKTKKTLVIITGINNILKKEPKVKEILKIIFKKVENQEKVNFAFVDEINNINEINKEFSKYISNENGIYVGSGIDSQYLFNIKNNNRTLREEITNEYGYVIIKGKTTKIKLINMLGENDEK